MPPTTRTGAVRPHPRLIRPPLPALFAALLGLAAPAAWAQDMPTAGVVNLSCAAPNAGATQLDTAPGRNSPWGVSVTFWGRLDDYSDPWTDLEVSSAPSTNLAWQAEASGPPVHADPLFPGSDAQWMRPLTGPGSYAYGERDGSQLSIYWLHVELPTQADADRLQLTMRYRAEDYVEGVWIGPGYDQVSHNSPPLINRLPSPATGNTSGSGTDPATARFGGPGVWKAGYNYFMVVVRSYPANHTNPPGGVSTQNIGFAAAFTANCDALAGPGSGVAAVPVGPWPPLAALLALAGAWGWRRRARGR